MMRKKLLIIGVIIVICLIGGYLFLLKQELPSSLQPLQPTKELKLSDFPEAFKKNTLIVIGDNASEIEMQAANDIASYLENETGNKPLVKKYSEVSNEDKKSYNLIVVGTPKSNPMLREIYEMAEVTVVNETYPGEWKGLLEITSNLWDGSDKLILLIEGSDEFGVKVGVTEIINIGKYTKILSSISKTNESIGNLSIVLDELYQAVESGNYY